MFCLLSVFLCCFCLHITEYKQIREGGGGPQNFIGPRGVKYLNTGLQNWFNYFVCLEISNIVDSKFYIKEAKKCKVHPITGHQGPRGGVEV
jgi:hypothetical protein